MKIFDEFKNKFGDRKDIPIINCMHCGKEFITYDDLNAHIPNCKFRKEAYKMISDFGGEVLADVKKERKVERQQSALSKPKKRKIIKINKISKISKISKKAKKSKRSSKVMCKKVNKKYISNKTNKIRKRKIGKKSKMGKNQKLRKRINLQRN